MHFGSWVCLCVCAPNIVYSSHKRYDLLNGSEGQNICAVFSENAPLAVAELERLQYRVKYQLSATM